MESRFERACTANSGFPLASAVDSESDFIPEMLLSEGTGVRRIATGPAFASVEQTMSPHSIHVKFSQRWQRWIARSNVNGALYTVRGRSPSAVFHELCDLLHVPPDGWRVVMLGGGGFACERLPPARTLEPPSTVDTPCLSA